MVPLHSASDLRVIIGGSREMKQPRWDVSTTSWRATISAILLMQQEAGGSAAWPARFSMSRPPGVSATHEAVQVRQRKGVVTSAVPTMDAVDRLGRKSVGEGKSVYVRVDRGGRRILKKKKKKVVIR